MIKKLTVILIIGLMFFSCASAPEGFEDSKAAALEAQVKAKENAADVEVPSRYGEAESALALAVEKEEAGDLEGAMEAYQLAEVKFNVAVAEANKKKDVDAFMEELSPVLDELDKQINSL